MFLITSCILSVTNAQNINLSGSTMTYEVAFNSLNTVNNSGNSGLAMGGFSAVASNSSSITYNSSNTLTLFEPRNEEITIEYDIPQSVYDDLVKIRNNAHMAYIIESLFNPSNTALLKYLSNYKYIDISAYNPVDLTLELRANPPTPVFKSALELQFAAMNYLQKPAGKMTFEIRR